MILRQTILAATLLFAAATAASGQSAYRIASGSAGSMKLSGTSSLHSWDMSAKAFSGVADFAFVAGKLTAIRALSFSLPVTNLKSKEKKMDKNAYKSLKSERYPNILFALSSATILPGTALDKYFVKATGNLTIAGVTRAVVMNVACALNPDASVTCSGSQSLKMSDYGVKPPTFMMGAMKTGDAVTLHFTLIYKK